MNCFEEAKINIVRETENDTVLSKVAKYIKES